MLSIFKINDPYRILLALGLLIVIRLPFLINGIPVSDEEIKWLTLGEALNQPGVVMYLDVWDNTAPLASWVYYLLNFLFGKSSLSLQLASILFITIQISIFNTLLIKNRAYKENTYIPSLIFIILSNLHTDFMTLSPQLMGITFILFSLNYLFKRIDEVARDEMFLYAGFNLGIASLFYLPYTIFLIFFIFILIIYTSAIPRRLLLLTFGFILLHLIVIFYYYFKNSLGIYIEFFFSSLYHLKSNVLEDYSSLIIFSIFPLLLLLVSTAKIILFISYANFQVKLQYALFFFLLFGIVTMFMAKDSGFHKLIFIIPCIAFFLTHWILSIKKSMQAELAVIMLLTGTILSSIYFDNNTDNNTDWDIANSSVTVLGDNIGFYHENSLAGPFLNWDITSYKMSQFNYQDRMSVLVYHLFDSKAEYIILIDEEIGKIARRMPLRQYYKPTTDENVLKYDPH